MSILESKGNDPLELFHLQHVVRAPDTDFCIAVALHARTGSSIDATISLSRAEEGLRDFYSPEEAQWYREQLTENHMIEPKSIDRTPLCVLPNELVKFGFNQDDICRIVEQSDGGVETIRA